MVFGDPDHYRLQIIMRPQTILECTAGCAGPCYDACLLFLDIVDINKVQFWLPPYVIINIKEWNKSSHFPSV